MSDGSDEALGLLIQSYVKSKWWGRSVNDSSSEAETRLDDGIKDRIDILGIDCERLLRVEASRVLAEIHRLEKEAAAEDARVVRSPKRPRTRGGKRS